VPVQPFNPEGNAEQVDTVVLNANPCDTEQIMQFMEASNTMLIVGRNVFEGISPNVVLGRELAHKKEMSGAHTVATCHAYYMKATFLNTCLLSSLTTDDIVRILVALCLLTLCTTLGLQNLIDRISNWTEQNRCRTNAEKKKIIIIFNPDNKTLAIPIFVMRAERGVPWERASQHRHCMQH
jgi:hypothetical protein